MTGEAPPDKPLRPPAALLLLQDLVFLLAVSLAHGTGAWTAWWCAVQVPFPLGFPVAVGLYPLVTLLVVIALDRTVPAVPVGRHAMGSPAFILWGIHLVLYRVVRIPPVIWLVRYSNVLRFIWLRGLGADAAFSAQMSGDVNLLDHRPLVLGAGCLLGSEVMVTTHMVIRGELRAEPVTVEEDAVVGARSVLGPGCRVGRHAVVEVGVLLGPGCKVGERARIGGASTLARDVEIGDGAFIEQRSHVEAGTRIGAGERWGGCPAQRVLSAEDARAKGSAGASPSREVQS
ncbi:MAG: hypothetical protein HY904_11935 [Deltaproteobacteria bacterium]|nr:hypothetical protein [Deltaproteobacteria bacterium]